MLQHKREKRFFSTIPFVVLLFFFLGRGGGGGLGVGRRVAALSEWLASNGNGAPRTKRSSNCYNRGPVELQAYKSRYTFFGGICPGQPIATGDTIHSALQGKHLKSDYLVLCNDVSN